VALRPARLLAVLVGLTMTVGSFAVATGQTGQPGATDRDMADGDAAAAAQHWEAAFAHYEAALRSAPTVRAELGAADALFHLDRAGEAYEEYAAVQSAQRPGLSAADEALVTARLRDLAARTGWLSVRIDEPGADVQVDGKRLGVSPVPALVRVSVGLHAVHVAKVGFVAFDASVQVTPDGQVLVDVPLAHQKTEGHVSVGSAGEPLRVIVDGVDVGATPWEGDLAPGAHEIAGRSSTAAATPQSITTAAGSNATVTLVATATAAHLQVRTSDGQGVIAVDGVAKGTGASSTDVVPGPHTISVTRDGYQPYEKSATLSPRETWAETVTLQPLAVAAGRSTGSPERTMEGFYGGFALAGLFGIGGMGTEIETHCSTLGAVSCNTPSPAGAGVLGYLGYGWNPVGFELVLGAAADTVEQKATFNASGGNSGTLPSTSPARLETFTFVRFGGLAALRARASAQWSSVRATLAGGAGLAYKEMLMRRVANASDGSGLHATYAPDAVAYVSPGVSVEGAIHVRATPSVAIALGVELWIENASIAGSNASPLKPGGEALTGGQRSASSPIEVIPTPQYHFASGPQVFLGPFLGMQFGP
jgi:hypothetical protein